MIIASNLPLLLFVVTGLVIPFLVDLITKKWASGAVKQSTLLALSLILNLLIEFTNSLGAGSVFDWQTALTGVVVTFITGVTTYLGLNKTKALGRESIISDAIPGGIGREQPIVPPQPEVANPATGTVPAEYVGRHRAPEQE